MKNSHRSIGQQSPCAGGADPFAEATQIHALLTPDERLGLLDGDLPFWQGFADMGRGGSNPTVTAIFARSTPFFGGVDLRLGTDSDRFRYRSVPADGARVRGGESHMGDPRNPAALHKARFSMRPTYRGETPTVVCSHLAGALTSRSSWPAMNHAFGAGSTGVASDCATADARVAQ